MRDNKYITIRKKAVKDIKKKAKTHHKGGIKNRYRYCVYVWVFAKRDAHRRLYADYENLSLKKS